MSESDTFPQDHLIEDASGAVPAPSQPAAPTTTTAAHSIVNAPSQPARSTAPTAEHSIANAFMLALPAEAHVLLSLICRALEAEADAATQDAACQVGPRFTAIPASAETGMPAAL